MNRRRDAAPALHPETEVRDARIREAVMGIPAGNVASYGDVAAIAGLAGRARLVGRVLRESPSGTALPWHRVLTASGRIAFAEQSEPFREQVRRLTAEGVEVRHGRVSMQRYRWSPDLDEMLWKPGAGWDKSGAAE